MGLYWKAQYLDGFSSGISSS
jgi:O-antigen ligase